MKFRKIFLLLIFVVMIVCYFTKPTKQDFIGYIQPMVAKTGIHPSVDYEDKFLYAKVTAIYVNALNPIIQNGRPVANAGKEEYIGIFKKFWKVGN